MVSEHLPLFEYAKLFSKLYVIFCISTPSHEFMTVPITPIIQYQELILILQIFYILAKIISV